MPTLGNKIREMLEETMISDEMIPPFNRSVNAIESDGSALRREIKELKEEVRALYSIIGGLVLRMDLKGLGIDPNEVFLPGLVSKEGRK